MGSTDNKVAATTLLRAIDSHYPRLWPHVDQAGARRRRVFAYLMNYKVKDSQRQTLGIGEIRVVVVNTARQIADADCRQSVATEGAI